MTIEAEKQFAATLSIFSNTVIIITKLIAGYISGSISIISEAIHSLSDFFASLMTLFAVTRSSEPADKEHPFGHGKYEDLSGFLEGLLIIFAGCYIIFEAAHKFLTGYKIESEPVMGIWVMGFAVIANFLVSRYLFYVAKKSDSMSLYADAKHLSTDIYSALGVFIGLILIKVTGIVLLDPIIAIGVSFIIIKAGFKISKATVNNLLDGAISQEDIQKVEKILQDNLLIKGYKNIKTRKIGHCKELEITILCNPDMKLSCCHKICDQIENEISKSLGDVSIQIHAEPSQMGNEIKS